jgi:hypothetical protein
MAAVPYACTIKPACWEQEAKQQFLMVKKPNRYTGSYEYIALHTGH